MSVHYYVLAFFILFSVGSIAYLTKGMKRIDEDMFVLDGDPNHYGDNVVKIITNIKGRGIDRDINISLGDVDEDNRMRVTKIKVYDNSDGGYYIFIEYELSKMVRTISDVESVDFKVSSVGREDYESWLKNEDDKNIADDIVGVKGDGLNE